MYIFFSLSSLFFRSFSYFIKTCKSCVLLLQILIFVVIHYQSLDVVCFIAFGRCAVLFYAVNYSAADSSISIFFSKSLSSVIILLRNFETRIPFLLFSTIISYVQPYFWYPMSSSVVCGCKMYNFDIENSIKCACLCCWVFKKRKASRKRVLHDSNRIALLITIA